MKTRIYTAAMIFLITAGCTAEFEKYNTDPNSIPEMQPPFLIPAMADALMFADAGNSQITDQMAGSLGGYFAISNRYGGENFDTFNASPLWNSMPYTTTFTSIYANFFEIKRFTGGEGHYFAMAMILRAGAMLRVADLYGGIPYSKVEDGLTYVEYDSCQEVYRNIIADLRKGAEILHAYATEHPDQHPLRDVDLIYRGDYALWARLANSLALRAAMRSGDKEAFKGIMESEAGLVETNSHNAFASSNLKPNPYHQASASWGDLRINSSIVDYMQGYKDPRMPAYFTRCTFQGSDIQYMGMRAGQADFEKAGTSGYSMPNFEKNSRIPVYVAAETSFLKAEAALKGWIQEDAGKLYEEGIRLSMEQYGVPSGEIEKYISDSSSTPADHKGDPRGTQYDYDRKTQVTVAWKAEGDEASKLEKIITQKWIAIYPMGLEAWAEFRRTGFPELAPAMDNLSNGVITDVVRGMRRLKYPYTEKDYNRDNYNAAVQEMGGRDDESVDLFWTRKQ